MANKIAVIGTINKDTIHFPSGEIHHSYGGILYNMVSLAQLLGQGYDIYAFANVGRDCIAAIQNIVVDYHNIKTDFINIVNSQANDCQLFYLDQRQKKEILKGGVPPLRFGDIKPSLSCDLIMVNFISGKDIGLQTLEKIRAEYKGTIYIDIHSLTLGIKDDGQRYLRRPHNWQRYAACADYLQMNAAEFELLAGIGPSHSILNTFFKIYGGKRPKALIVTAGSEGTFITSVEKSAIKSRFIESPKVDDSLDTTGCGDVFGASFMAAILRGHNLDKAVQIANDRAAQKCYTCGIEKLRLTPL